MSVKWIQKCQTLSGKGSLGTQTWRLIHSILWAPCAVVRAGEITAACLLGGITIHQCTTEVTTFPEVMIYWSQILGATELIVRRLFVTLASEQRLLSLWMQHTWHKPEILPASTITCSVLWVESLVHQKAGLSPPLSILREVHKINIPHKSSACLT